ncbi:MAG TPA: alpha/beta hydrolase [Noviherbaspirillum sp.]|jgi:pimeloyl-ACP methyl ester carboxylesterase|uniref:alpha/beta fold hydrolase n=1 Tax=Noviherbaspirillum sp. TaxID=1926288 RepID=UPI002F952BAF
MFAMPLPFLLAVMAGLASLALLAGGVAILVLWVQGGLAGASWLLAGAAMLLWALFGRLLVLAVYPSGDAAPPVMRRAAGKKIQAPDGSILHVESEGPADAPVIVLTHDWGLDSSAWQDVRATLSQRYRLLSWDLPGLGRSRGPVDGGYSMARLAEDLRRVIDEAGARPVTLVGHGIGAMMVLTLCRLHPDLMTRKVNGIVLMDATHRSPLRGGGGAGLLRLLRWPLVEPLLLLTILLWPLAWLLNVQSYASGLAHLGNRMSVFSGTVTRRQLDHAARTHLRHKPSVLAKGLRAMLQWDESATPARIPVVTRVTAGESDRLTPPEAGRQLAALIPRADFVGIAAAGHHAPLQEGRRYAELIAQLADKANTPAAAAGTSHPQE